MTKYLLALFLFLSGYAYAGMTGVPPTYTCNTDSWINALNGDQPPSCAPIASSNLSDASNVCLYDNESKTWGAGSPFTWEFNAGTTDPTITFDNNVISTPNYFRAGADLSVSLLARYLFATVNPTDDLRNLTSYFANDADDTAVIAFRSLANSTNTGSHEGTGGTVRGLISEAYQSEAGTRDTLIAGEFTAEADDGTVAGISGLQSFAANYSGNTASALYGLNIFTDGNDITTAFGIHIGNVVAGATNYAIYTNGGTVHLGDNVEIADANELRLLEDAGNGTNYQALKAADDLSADTILALNIVPGTCTGDGNNGCLTVNGSNEIVCSADDGGGGAGDIGTVGSCTSGDCAIEGGNDIFPFIYEGTANDFETTFAVTDPTTPDKTITFPDASGEVTLLGQEIALTTETSGNYVASVGTSSPLSGGAGGSEGAAISLTIADAAADGSTKGAASFTANDFDASSGNISIDYTNGQASSGSTKGFLTSTDWNTFNGKISSSVLTTEGDIIYRDGSGVNRLARGAEGTVLKATATTIGWGTDETGGSSGGTKCFVLAAVDANDDNEFITSFDSNTTALNIWCNYQGSAPSTAAAFAIDVAGTTMTLSATPTCAGPTSAATAVTCNSNCTMTAKTPVRFSVTNTPNPATDTYILCISY